MPNHVTTIIRVNPQVAEALLHHTTEEEQQAHLEEEVERRAEVMARTGRQITVPHERLADVRVDFANVIPEPESIFHGGCNSQHPHPKEDGSGFYEHCWYNWNIEHWGTKWNAYDSSVTGGPGDQAIVQFDTAWSHPAPVIEALSRRFPDENIDVMFADEDLGFNLGAYTMRNGEVVSESIPEPGSDQALELASQIKYGRPYAELKAEWDEDEARWEAEQAAKETATPVAEIEAS